MYFPENVHTHVSFAQKKITFQVYSHLGLNASIVFTLDKKRILIIPTCLINVLILTKIYLKLHRGDCLLNNLKEMLFINMFYG